MWQAKIWKSGAHDHRDKFTNNNNLWDQYLTELEAFKQVPSQLTEVYWIEKISSESILEHTFQNGASGYKFLQALWDWKFNQKTLPKTVAILEKIEDLIIGGYLKYPLCIGCSRGYDDCVSLCKHLIVHQNNVERSRGRDYDSLMKERTGRRQLDCIRRLLNDGKLAHLGSFPRWMSFPPPRPTASVPAPPSTHHSIETRSSSRSIKPGSSHNVIKPGSSHNVIKLDTSHAGIKLGSSHNVIKLGSSPDGIKLDSSHNVIKLDTSPAGIKFGSSHDGIKLDSSHNVIKLDTSHAGIKFGSSHDGIKLGSSLDGIKVSSSAHSIKTGSTPSGPDITKPVFSKPTSLPGSNKPASLLLLKSDHQSHTSSAKPVSTGSSHVISKSVASAGPCLVKVNQSPHGDPSRKVINGSITPSQVKCSPNIAAHRLVVAPSSAKTRPNEAFHQLQMGTSHVSPQIKPHANDTTHCFPATPTTRVQTHSAVYQVSQSFVKPLASEATPLVPSVPSLIKFPHNGVVPVSTASPANEAPHKLNPLHANPFTSGKQLITASASNVTSGSSLLLPSSVNNNKRKTDASEIYCKKVKLESILSPRNSNTVVDTFLHQVPSNVKSVISGSSLLPSSSAHINKRKPDALESDSKRIKLQSLLKNNNAVSTKTGLDPQTGDYSPKPVPVISKRLNIYGPSDRVESVVEKFKRFGEDNQKEGKLNTLEILEKLLEGKEVAPDKMENKPLWGTLEEEKIESPSFDPKNEAHFPHFLANWTCINDCISKATEHGRLCRGDLEPNVGGTYSAGLTNKEAKYTCTMCNITYSFRPSPRFGNRGISDYISCFCAETCGGKKSHLKRHYEGLGMTSPARSTFLDGAFNMDLLRKLTQEKADETKTKALQKCLIKNDGNVRIKIDMAHQNRVNSGSSTLTGMDTSTNDILFTHHKHRSEEPISQKHESSAADDMCRLIQRLELLLQIAITDKGSSAQKIIKEYFPECIIQWDNWHALKGLERALTKLFGNDEALEDKIKKIRGHVYWTLNNYKLTTEEYLDPEKRRVAQEEVQQCILQLCNHFQGAVPDDVDDEGFEFHAGCNDTSRCHTDENYVNSRIVLTEAEAQKLREFLEKTDFIKNTDKFLLDMHSQELIDGKFEMGERIYEKEASRGPVGNSKRETPKRDFVKELMSLYFSEIVKCDQTKPNQPDRAEDEAEDEEDKRDSEESDDDADDEEPEEDNVRDDAEEKEELSDRDYSGSEDDEEYLNLGKCDTKTIAVHLS